MVEKLFVPGSPMVKKTHPYQQQLTSSEITLKNHFISIAPSISQITVYFLYMLTGELVRECYSQVCCVVYNLKST